MDPSKHAALVDRLRAHVAAGAHGGGGAGGGNRRRSMSDAPPSLDPVAGRNRTRSMGDYEPDRRASTFRSRRSSFSEIVIKKWHQPHRERRDSFSAMTAGGVEGSLVAWNLNQHIFLWRSLAKRGNLILDSTIRALHRCPSLKVQRLGPGGAATAADVLEDDAGDVEMVAVLREFDVLFLEKYAADAVHCLDPWFDGVEVVGRAGQRLDVALTGHGATRRFTLVFTGATEDGSAEEVESVFHPFIVLRRKEFLASRVAKHGGLATAIDDLKAAAAKRRIDAPPYFLELLCINEYEDRNRPLQENLNRPSTARSKRPSFDAGSAPSPADAEILKLANVKEILKRQLEPDQFSLLCPVTHRHVLCPKDAAAAFNELAASAH